MGIIYFRCRGVAVYISGKKLNYKSCFKKVNSIYRGNRFKMFSYTLIRAVFAYLQNLYQNSAERFC